MGLLTQFDGMQALVGSQEFLKNAEGRSGKSSRFLGCQPLSPPVLTCHRALNNEDLHLPSWRLKSAALEERVRLLAACSSQLQAGV
jgi:hypothetical protein